MMNEQKEKEIAISNSEANSNKNDVAQSYNSLSAINLLDDTQILQFESFLRRLVSSDKGGIKTVQDGIAIAMRAQDLSLPFSTCLEHVHVINGKTGVDIHIVKALVTRAGVTWNCDKDYTPLYEYTDGINVYSDNALPEYTKKCISKEEAIQITNDDVIGVYPVRYYKDFSGNVYKDYQMTTKFSIALNTTHAAEIQKAGKIAVYRIPAVPIDYVTSYTLTRSRIINGKEVITTSKGSFSYSEALTAGLFNKTTYVQYAKTLIGHRAFTYAARDIASDILFGVMETTELKIVCGKELDNRDIIDIQAQPID